jgi:ribosomal protein L16 Arg81 hydroxylase
VQEAGEMIFIPPKMWHQVYHLEPSVAVAGQLMNEANEMGVYRHILEWCYSTDQSTAVEASTVIEEFLSDSKFLSMERRERIAAVIWKGLKAQHGKSSAQTFYSELYGQRANDDE